MDPQDDPEARIRELERSLADQARKSELGDRPQQSYSDPPASQTSYGAPFRPTPRTRSGIPTRWIVLGVLFIVVIFVAPIVVGMVIMYTAVNSAFDEARQSPDATSTTDDDHDDDDYDDQHTHQHDDTDHHRGFDRAGAAQRGPLLRLRG